MREWKSFFASRQEITLYKLCTFPVRRIYIPGEDVHSRWGTNPIAGEDIHSQWSTSPFPVRIYIPSEAHPKSGSGDVPHRECISFTWNAHSLYRVRISSERCWKLRSLKIKTNFFICCSSRELNVGKNFRSSEFAFSCQHTWNLAHNLLNLQTA